MNFVQFPNGKVWVVDAHNFIKGTVLVPDYLSLDDIDARNDALSVAATGSTIGLSDISAESIGGDMVSFSAYAEMLVTEDDDGEMPERNVLNVDDPNLRAALMAQYGLNDIEADHAIANIESFGCDEDECVIQVAASNRQIRTPAHPAECNYVRVVAGGFEIARWVDDEWRDDPAVVMGALMGAAAAKAGG